jgi:hypothetical protein
MPVLDFILAYMRWFALLCVDMWIDCNNRYNRWQKARACAYANMHITRLNAQSTNFIAAYAEGKNISPAVQTFYPHNEVISCYRLQKWMKECGVDTNRVHIYTMRGGVVYHSHVDLDNNKMLLTGEEIEDLTIELLPSVDMIDHDRS